MDLVVGEFRQDRRAFLGGVGAAFRDLDGVLQSLGQIGEKGRHLVGGLQIVLRSEAAAGFLLVDISALGDADQRVMGLVHVGLREINVVGGDQGQTQRIGHLDMAAFGRTFGLGILPALARMALQLDIEPVGIGGGEAFQKRLGLDALPRLQQAADGSVGAAGEADEAIGMGLQLLGRHMRQRSVAP